MHVNAPEGLIYCRVNVQCGPPETERSSATASTPPHAKLPKAVCQRGTVQLAHEYPRPRLGGELANVQSTMHSMGIPLLLLFSHLCFFYQLRLQGKSLHPSTIPAQVHGFHTGGDETAELRILRQNNIIGLPAEQGGASGERVPAALALWLECLDEPHL